MSVPSLMRLIFSNCFPRLFKKREKEQEGRSSGAVARMLDPWIISTTVLGIALVIMFVMFALAIFRIHRMHKQLCTRPSDGAYPVVKGSREGMQVVAVWEGGNSANQHWRPSPPNKDQSLLSPIQEAVEDVEFSPPAASPVAKMQSLEHALKQSEEQARFEPFAAANTVPGPETYGTCKSSPDDAQLSAIDTWAGSNDVELGSGRNSMRRSDHGSLDTQQTISNSSVASSPLVAPTQIPHPAKAFVPLSLAEPEHGQCHIALPPRRTRQNTGPTKRRQENDQGIGQVQGSGASGDFHPRANGEHSGERRERGGSVEPLQAQSIGSRPLPMHAQNTTATGTDDGRERFRVAIGKGWQRGQREANVNNGQSENGRMSEDGRGQRNVYPDRGSVPPTPPRLPARTSKTKCGVGEASRTKQQSLRDVLDKSIARHAVPRPLGNSLTNTPIHNRSDKYVCIESDRPATRAVPIVYDIYEYPRDRSPYNEVKNEGEAALRQAWSAGVSPPSAARPYGSDWETPRAQREGPPPIELPIRQERELTPPPSDSMVSREWIPPLPVRERISLDVW